MAYALKYGSSYSFPPGFRPAEDSLEWQIPQAKLPRADGGIVIRGYKDAKKITIEGGIIRGPLSPTTVVRDKFDDLKAALSDQPRNLYFDDDRYLRCTRVESLANSYDATDYGRIANRIRIGFVTSDPFWYSNTLTTDTWNAPASGGTHTITPGGNAAALPEISLTVGGSGAQTLNWTFYNDTTGESFTLTGDVTGGDVIVVDCLLRTCVIGSNDEMALFDGLFPSLSASVVNTLRVTYGATAISSVGFSFRDRWS